MRHTFSFTCLRLFAFLFGIVVPIGILILYYQSNTTIQPFILVGLFSISFLVSTLLYCTRYRHYSLHYIDTLSGEEFEEYVKHYFRHVGYRNIRTTKTTRDYGADILMKKGFHKVVVQAKRYDRNIGVHAIQEVLASKAYYQCSKAIVITNQYYTSSAIALAKVNDVQLIDRNSLSF